MKETRKCIEIYITKTKKEGSTEESIEFRNVIEDTPENEEWMKSASSIIKQVAFILYKLHEEDIEESEVTYKDDKKGTRSE